MSKPKYYVLPMFPYPSGFAMHVGHVSNFLITEFVAKTKRMQGYDVIFPLGYDSFGLPTENFAIKNNKSAHDATVENIAYYEKQLEQVGFSFDKDRRLATSDPEYYKRSQRIFAKLFEHGMAYKKDGLVNRCPVDQTVLANDQVVDGKCERCESVVIQKQMPQWYIKITDYCEQLLDYSDCDRPEETKIHQKNWIGRSEGAEISFMIADDSEMISDDKSKPNSDITYDIIWSAYEVHKQLWSWLSEKIYHNAIKLALEKKWYNVESQFKLDYSFDWQKIWAWFVDLVVNGSIVIELKSRKEFQSENYKQLRSYINQWNFETGLLINFYNNKVETKRLDNENYTNQSSEIIWINHQTSITVFTTRPDTIYGVTAIVLAPENQIIDHLLDAQKAAELKDFRAEVAKLNSIDRQSTERTKNGMDSGAFVRHPLNGEQVPVWFGDYVLPDYATGAVMFVPAHDERDYEFAQKYNIEVKQVIAGNFVWEDGLDPHATAPLLLREGGSYTGTGILVNSGQFDGLDNIEAKAKITTYLESIGKGNRKITYRLRDLSISRLRYRRSPIPIYYTFADNEEVPFFKYTTGDKGFKEGFPTLSRNVIQVIVKDKNSDQFCFLQWTHDQDYSGFFGWIEEWETAQEAALRELKEEAGFEKATFVKELVSYQLQFFHPVKQRNQYSMNTTLYFEVDKADQKPVNAEELEQHALAWMTAEEFMSKSKNDTTLFAMKVLSGDNSLPTGRTMQSKYNAYNPHPDKSKWIPHAIPDDELPVILPLDLPNYKPAGKSPLEDHPTFKYYHAKDGNTYLRECDTLDTFMCSSFYYLRFLDPHNEKQLISEENCKYMPVDLYVGGKEHTVGHLIYARFIYKFLQDKGYIHNESKEPFAKLVHQGMIQGPDGRKMSKRRGNIIDPVDIITQFNADTLRTYIAFMGPIDINKNWNPDSVAGVKRFLDRVERATQYIGKWENLDSLTQTTIQWVSQDMEALKFNTAVSKLMILINEVYDKQSISKENFEILLLLLSVFATESAQKLWLKIGNTGNIADQARPHYDSSKVLDQIINLPIQINGKLKGTLEVTKDISQEEVLELVKGDEKLNRYLDEGSIKKIIRVPGKICNIIIS